MQVEKTIPEEIKISDILEFVINVSGLTIDIHLANGGGSYTLNRTGFLDFWNNTMNATQRAVVRQFVLQLSALAAKVSEEKITGTFGG